MGRPRNGLPARTRATSRVTSAASDVKPDVIDDEIDDRLRSSCAVDEIDDVIDEEKRSSIGLAGRDAGRAAARPRGAAVGFLYEDLLHTTRGRQKDVDRIFSKSP